MKDNQHEQLFTELTPVEAAAVEGGASFESTVRFDASLTSRQFRVQPGGTIQLVSDTYNVGRPLSDNPTFYAAIRNVNTGNKDEKVASVGKDTTIWTGVRGGTYVIDFRDRDDNIVVAGDVRVTYS